ncbi:hypothetical protein FRX31_028307, partial [Thalictrum thalictroides]
NDLICKEDLVDLLKFGALTWEVKRKLIPYLNHLFVTPREKNQGKFVTPEGDCVLRRIRVKGSFKGLPTAEIVEFDPNDPVVLAVPIEMSKQVKGSTRRRPAMPKDDLFSGSQEPVTLIESQQSRKRKSTSEPAGDVEHPSGGGSLLEVAPSSSTHVNNSKEKGIAPSG